MLSDYLPSRDTLKYDLQILGGILVGLPAYFDKLPMLGPTAQQWIMLGSIIYTIAVGAARPTPKDSN